MKNNSLKEIAKQLNNAKTVAIFCHARPDGDAIGSAVALCLALNNAGKRAFAICEEKPAEKFNFIEGVELMQSELPQENFDTFVCVDCADVARTGVFANDFYKFKGVKINIDHHFSNDGYATYNYVYECSATCQLMPEILNACGFEIDKKIANLLMLGLITDSGNFVHQDVNEQTFAVASLLRKKGADVNAINYNMFTRQTKARALLYVKVLSKMRFALQDKLAILIVTENDFKEFSADRNMTEGFVDFPLTIEGVEVSGAIMEVKKNQYKVSLRSKGTVNVNSVASTFGGGGHILASGCMLFGELEEVIEKLTYAVYQNL